MRFVPRGLRESLFVQNGIRKPVPPKALLERIREALRLDAQARDATAQHAELADRIAREPEEGDDRREATGCRASRSGA